jgi:hypothetical protein
VVLKKVHCGNTEDIHGADESYVAGTMTDGTESGTQVSLMSPQSINYNQEIWPGWSIVTPIGSSTYQADHLIVYNKDTGQVRIDRFAAGGAGTVNVFDAGWATGWSTLMPFRLSGTSWHFLIYNADTGMFHIDQFDDPTLGSNTMLAGTWAPGWTSFMAYPEIVFDASPDHFFMAYNATTGAAHFDRISPTGFEIIQQDTWAPGWTHLAPVLLGGTETAQSSPGMLVYDAGSGTVHSDRLL